MNALDAQTQLKACPLCSSTRITVWGIRDGMRAVCKDCKCEGPPAFHGPNLDTVERAIAAWNTRANPDADALAKALEEAAAWFEGYATEHYRKAMDAPSYAEHRSYETKGKTNAHRAAELRAALTAYRANGAS